MYNQTCSQFPKPKGHLLPHPGSERSQLLHSKKIKHIIFQVCHCFPPSRGFSCPWDHQGCLAACPYLSNASMLPLWWVHNPSVALPFHLSSALHVFTNLLALLRWQSIPIVGYQNNLCQRDQYAQALSATIQRTVETLLMFCCIFHLKAAFTWLFSCNVNPSCKNLLIPVPGLCALSHDHCR